MFQHNLASLIQFFKNSGWGFDAGDQTPHPARRDNVMEAFELSCTVALQEWAQENVYSYLIHEVDREYQTCTHAEWDFGNQAYRFSVTVEGMGLADLWWMLGEHVVYKHFCDHTLRSGSWNSTNRYKIIEHALEIGAQVVGATPTEGGMTIDMAASRFRDPETSEDWDQKVENGLGDWDYHKQMENNQ